MSQQGRRQASVRAITGTTETYNGDWHALFTLAGIATGPFNGRFLAWINLKLSANYTNLPEAKQALATYYGAANFASLGTFDASSSTVVIPVNTVAPVIAGSQSEGSTLSVTDNGTWDHSPTSFTYQWKMGGVNISGATSSSWARDANSVGGGTITCEVTGVNAAGSSLLPGVSNALASTLNGIIAAFAFRPTSTTVNSRWSYYLDADKPNLITRAPAAGPAPATGDYTAAVTGSVNSGGNDTSYGNNLTGYMSVSGSGGRFRFTSIPTGVPLAIRCALGPGFTSSTTGLAFYDGDPDAGGVKLFEIGAITAADYLLDASNTPRAANLWDATNQPRLLKTDNVTPITSTTGEIWIARNAAQNVIYLRAVMISYASYVQETSGTGPYFVNYTSGSNIYDGKSSGQAWKNFPGDPDAVGGVVKDFVLLPGAVVNVEGGQIHKPAGFGSRTTWLFQKAAGTLANPIIVQPRSGTGEVIFDGTEDLAFTTSVLSSDVYGNANYANITTHTGAASSAMVKAPVCAGVPLRPAVWPSPSDITAYDFSDSGSESYWAEDTTTGPGGSAPLFVTGAADSGGAGYRKVTYSGTRVLSHYGSVSLVGYQIWCRYSGNQIFGKTITSHNTATGAFTFNIDNSSSVEELYSPVAVSGFQDFLWQIRYHPFDIVAEGQYAYSTILSKHVGWFPASGTRGLTRFDRFMTAQYGDWQFNGGSDGIQIRGLMGDSVFVVNDASNVSPFPQYHPDRIVFDKVKTRGTSDLGRNYLFQQAGGGTAWSLTNIDIADNFLSGGVAILKGFNAVLGPIKYRECGRTLAYNGGTSGNQSTDITWSNLDLSDNSGIHANGGTVYQDAQRVKMLGVTAANNIRPFTSQGYTNDFSRNNEIGRYIAIGRLQPGYAPRVVSHVVQTNDNNGTNSWWHHGIVAEAAGMLVGPNSAGMLVENVYASQIGETQPNYVTGMTFRNCLFGDGGAFTSVSDLTSNGATCTNVTFTSAAWDGTITPAIRQKLTANGVLGTYSDVTLGATGQTWFIPAYGTTFALQDAILTTTSVRKNFQGGRPFAQVLNTSPESVITLPSGVSGSNNSLFTMTRGKIAFTTTPTDPAGTTYNLDVLQTNASADRTGSSTKTTRFVITLV